jgi:hypothetical protein
LTALFQFGIGSDHGQRPSIFTRHAQLLPQLGRPSPTGGTRSSSALAGISSLYSKFYEQEDLKGVREILDSELPTSAEIQKLVAEQEARFTDYLNFFEFMAYLNECRQLSDKDVRALFHYYLHAMWKHEAVRKYILGDKKGYDYLRKLLPKRKL